MSKFSYTVQEKDKGVPLKQLLRRNFTFSSRMMSRFKKNGCILLNGKAVRLYVIPSPGDVISIDLPDEQSHFDPQPVPIIPAYEDSDLLIIDKRPGYVVHPTHGRPDFTIANGLMQYMLDTDQNFKIRFVNRLDMDTSGLLIIAKNAHCQEELIKQMKENKVEKKYVAIVCGLIPEDSGTINLPIGKPDPDKPARGVTENGYPSTTHYTVLRRFSTGYSLVELRLETGRTHQIRVHMSYIGHPVAADQLYGAPCDLPIKRQALHAKEVSFYHPITQEFMSVEAEIPSDMRMLIEFIR